MANSDHTSHLLGAVLEVAIWECDVCGWLGESKENPHDCSGIPPLPLSVEVTDRIREAMGEAMAGG